MTFRIADSFTESLARLGDTEQKRKSGGIVARVINLPGNEIVKVLHGS